MLTPRLRTADGRAAFRRIAGALFLIAFGSGVVASAWTHRLAAAGYVPPRALTALFDAYARGEPGMVGVVVAAGPVLEELLLRGLLLTALLWFYRPSVAVGGSAVVFAAAHLNVFQSPRRAPTAPSRRGGAPRAVWRSPMGSSGSGARWRLYRPRDGPRGARSCRARPRAGVSS